MSHDYPLEIATHYAAYRPPLHALILERYWPSGKSFHSGLDIGSGTGQSAIALAQYGDRVIGVEPSRDMLRLALPYPNVEYAHFDGKTMPFPDQSFDMITFAGSLFYAKSQFLLDEVIRVCQDQATVLIYDFEVLLDDLYPPLIPQTEPSDYDHTIDFSGLKMAGLRKQISDTDQVALHLSAANLAHLLLSVKSIYQHFVEKYSTKDPYPPLVDNLGKLSEKDNYTLPVDIYFTRYDFFR